MSRIRLKYVHAFVDRHGHPRFYFRRAGAKRTALPGLPGSAEFMQCYQALLTNAPPVLVGARRNAVGSVAAAVTGYFGSAEFINLAKTSQVSRRQILERFRREHGHRAIAELKHSHVRLMMDALAKTPGAALNFRTALRALIRYSIAVGLRPDDPTIGISTPKLRRGGHYTWSEADIERFEARHPIGTKARLALALLLYTVQRRADVIGLGWQHIGNGKIRLRQQKTGKPLTIPIHVELQKVLDATPTQNMTFLVTDQGRPYSPDGFTHWFGKRCAEAGLPERASPHGLRKAGCRRLAEAGCSMKVIAALSGHSSLRELARYTDAAEQEKLAEQAIAAITRPSSGNREAQFANHVPKGLK